RYSPRTELPESRSRTSPVKVTMAPISPPRARSPITSCSCEKSACCTRMSTFISASSDWREEGDFIAISNCGVQAADFLIHSNQHLFGEQNLAPGFAVGVSKLCHHIPHLTQIFTPGQRSRITVEGFAQIREEMHLNHCPPSSA